MWRGVRFQKSVSGKHISLTALRGKHGSLGICVRGNIYHCDTASLHSSKIFLLIFNAAVFVNTMLNKNTPGAKKSEAKSEAPVSSYSYMRLKSVISG